MDRSHIAALFRQHGPMVYRRARWLLGRHEEAEEATQEVFLRVLRSIDEFRGQSSPSTWLYSVTTHYCLNLLRDRRRRRDLLREHLADSTGFAPDQATTDPATLLLLRRLLGEVPDERWAQAAVCVYLDGMSHEEAAEVLSVSKRTVGNLLERFAGWAQEKVKARAMAEPTAEAAAGATSSTGDG